MNTRTRKIFFSAVVVVVTAISLGVLISMKVGESKDKTGAASKGKNKMTSKKIKLPEPDTKGTMTVEKAISLRRSRRDFTDERLQLKQLGQLLWSAQGCTGAGCLKAAPSAGATFPLEVFAVVGDGGVEGLDAGVYRYLSEDHEIMLHKEGDARKALTSAALDQMWVLMAPLSIVISADYSRTTTRYGQRGMMYVHMEAGHASENIYLQAEALGLGTVAIGAFHGKDAAYAVGAGKNLDVLYIMPVGKHK